MPPELFDRSSVDAYLQHFSDTGVNIGYAISENAVLSHLHPYLQRLSSRGQGARVLEVGAGPGRSSYRMVEELNRRGSANFDLVSTEINWEFIQASLEAHAHDIKTITPRLQMAAEAISFPTCHFDAVMGSQVIHWTDVYQFIPEAARVLKSGGLFVQAGSGINKKLPHEHFTDNVVYRYFEDVVRQQLEERKLWSEVFGEFNPKNSLVNP